MQETFQALFHSTSSSSRPWIKRLQGKSRKGERLVRVNLVSHKLCVCRLIRVKWFSLNQKKPKKDESSLPFPLNVTYSLVRALLPPPECLCFMVCSRVIKHLLWLSSTVKWIKMLALKSLRTLINSKHALLSSFSDLLVLVCWTLHLVCVYLSQHIIQLVYARRRHANAIPSLSHNSRMPARACGMKNLKSVGEKIKKTSELKKKLRSQRIYLLPCRRCCSLWLAVLLFIE